MCRYGVRACLRASACVCVRVHPCIRVRACVETTMQRDSSPRLRRRGRSEDKKAWQCSFLGESCSPVNCPGIHSNQRPNVSCYAGLRAAGRAADAACSRTSESCSPLLSVCRAGGERVSSRAPFGFPPPGPQSPRITAALSRGKRAASNRQILGGTGGSLRWPLIHNTHYYRCIVDLEKIWHWGPLSDYALYPMRHRDLL